MSRYKVNLENNDNPVYVKSEGIGFSCALCVDFLILVLCHAFMQGAELCSTAVDKE
jgi:hypothetical protein